MAHLCGQGALQALSYAISIALGLAEDDDLAGARIDCEQVWQHLLNLLEGHLHPEHPASIKYGSQTILPLLKVASRLRFQRMKPKQLLALQTYRQMIRQLTKLADWQTLQLLPGPASVCLAQ